MKIDKFIKLTLFLITTVISTSKIQAMENSNNKSINKSILGKYIDDRNVLKIISDYLGVVISELKVLDVQSHIKTATLRNGKDIICLSRAETYRNYLQKYTIEYKLLGQEYYEKLNNEKSPYYVIKIINLENLKCKSIIDYGSIYDNYLIPTFIGLLINNECLEKKRSCIRQREVKAVNISPNGKMVSVYSTFRNLFLPETKIFDIESNRCLLNITHDDHSILSHYKLTEKEFNTKLPEKFENKFITNHFIFSNDKKYLAIALKDKIEIYDTNANLVNEIYDHIQDISYMLLPMRNEIDLSFTLLAFSNNSDYLAAYKTGLLKIWELNSNENIATLKINNKDNYGDGALFFSSNDKYLILIQGNFIYRWLNQSVGITIDEIPEIQESNDMRNTLCSIQ